MMTHLMHMKHCLMQHKNDTEHETITTKITTKGPTECSKTTMVSCLFSTVVVVVVVEYQDHSHTYQQHRTFQDNHGHQVVVECRVVLVVVVVSMHHLSFLEWDK